MVFFSSSFKQPFSFQWFLLLNSITIWLNVGQYSKRSVMLLLLGLVHKNLPLTIFTVFFFSFFPILWTEWRVSGQKKGMNKTERILDLWVISWSRTCSHPLQQHSLGSISVQCLWCDLWQFVIIIAVILPNQRQPSGTIWDVITISKIL